jgi:hypothetical protein
MKKTKRTFEVDAFILEALKLVKRSPEDGKSKPGEARKLEKKDVQTTKDVVMKLIDSIKEA